MAKPVSHTDGPNASARILLEFVDSTPVADHVAEAGVERTQRVRQTLRRLLLANNGAPVYPLDVAVLNQAAAEMPFTLRFLPGGRSRLDALPTAAEAALAKVLLAAHAAMADGTWRRLKVCAAEECSRAFFDHSKNRSRAWCAMGTCGNRTKARRHRERQRRFEETPGRA